MGNWRTVMVSGTMTAEHAEALREYLGYPSYRWGDRTQHPAYQRFGPLSFCRDQPSLCGLNDWPAPRMVRAGNLAERDYEVTDVAKHLRELVTVAPSMLMKVHCGGEWESEECVATISVGDGLVSVGHPEVKEIAGPSEVQMYGNLMRNLLR